jgi:hypothetical protein
MLMQFPRASKLLLIFAPSSKPLLLESKLHFSDPAKSIIVSFGLNY